MINNPNTSFLCMQQAYVDGCTTRTDRTNGGGLWILSRSPELSSQGLKDARAELKRLGYS